MLELEIHRPIVASIKPAQLKPGQGFSSKERILMVCFKSKHSNCCSWSVNFSFQCICPGYICRTASGCA